MKHVKLFIYKSENAVKLNEIKYKSFFSVQCFLVQKKGIVSQIKNEVHYLFIINFNTQFINRMET